MLNSSMDSRVDIPTSRLAPNPVLSNSLALESIAGEGALLGEEMKITLSLKDLKRFFSKLTTVGNCWIWVGSKNQYGYGHMSVQKKLIPAHRISFSVLVGKIPDKAWVLHKKCCASRACVNPDHLYLGDNTDNVADRIAWGKNLCGEEHGSSKLSNKEIKGIRLCWKIGNLKAAEIAEMYGVSEGHIYKIVSGRAWAHIPHEAT